jgi:hypothetical protein
MSAAAHDVPSVVRRSVSMRLPRTASRRLWRASIALAVVVTGLTVMPVGVFGAGNVFNATVTDSGPRPVEAPLASSILGVARAAVGTYQGECFPWVRRVVEQATGRPMGFGYRDGYLSAGAVEVSLADARGGDIIQLINDADSGANADYPGMHTSIVSEAVGGGVFRVIDSNLYFDGVVRVRDSYDPRALAARYSNISVHVYRFGATATPQSTQLLSVASGGGTTATAPQQATTATATIRADGDCLRLRAAPSITAPVLTCLADGGTVTLLDGTQQADGVTWQAVSAGGRSGWVASQYLVRNNSTSAPAPAPSSPVSTAPPPSAAPGSPSIVGDVQAGGGLALVVFSGGSTDSLLGVISGRGCSAVSIWASQTGGGLVGMIVGAPSVVNRAWGTQFPSGDLPPSSPLIVVCRGGGPPPMVAQPPSASAPAPAPAPAGPTNRGSSPPGPAGNE